jgi:hypothetical protein
MPRKLYARGRTLSRNVDGRVERAGGDVGLAASGLARQCRSAVFRLMQVVEAKLTAMSALDAAGPGKRH